MNIKGLKIGFCITGSFCTFDQIIPEVTKLVIRGADVTPIFSNAVYTMDTRFFLAKEFQTIIESITGKKIIKDIVEVEPIGPKKLMDVIVVAPCTGNTIAKLTYGITDTAVTMACKSHLRNQRPVIIGISTNDGLGGNAKNIGLLLNTKNIYFVPFGQDDAIKKNNSLVSKLEMILPTIEDAIEGRQIQPLLV
ncbi:MAG TPA: dipicolinate synthase subunit B [Clostridia bacterium]|nr:dipicolinate synthase subunit B [Clostridia bacterium]